MFLHQCAKQAGTNDDARWGKYLHFAARAIPKGAGYSGHDLVPAAICDSVSGTGLAARPASLAPAGDRKKGTAAIADKHGHDSLSRSRLAALPASLAPAPDPKKGTAARADKRGHDSVAQSGLAALPAGLYFERQVSGTLTCGCHAINHILQRQAFSIAAFEKVQLDTARDLFERPSQHGCSTRVGDWSIETLGRALRLQNCEMSMVANWLQSPQSAFDNAVGILLGSGQHWTSLLLRDGKMLHFDSLSQAPTFVTDLAHFARR